MDKFPSVPRLNIQQPFSKMFEKATSFLRLSNGIKAPALDGEIVYSKNNVCVHRVGGDERIPGYLSLRCSVAEVSEKQMDSTLILHWVPNTTICRNPKSVDSPVGTPPRNSSSAANLIDLGADCNLSGNNSTLPGLQPTKHTDLYVTSCSSTSDIKIDFSGACSNEFRNSLSVKYVPSRSGSSKSSNSNSLEDFVVISSEDSKATANGNDNSLNGPCSKIRNSNIPDIDNGQETNSFSAVSAESLQSKRPLTLSLSHSLAQDGLDGDDTDSMCSSVTGGPDSDRSFSPTSISEISSMCDIISLTETAESIAETHNLMFPADELTLINSYPKQAASSASDSSIPAKPGVFSVNLGAMRSLRLFFSEDSASCGQLVIASRESQYKIFHFYNGGLDKLAEILEEWNLFHSAKQQRWRNGAISSFSQQFRVVKPNIGEEVDIHPEDRLYQKLNASKWKLFMNEQGQICDEPSFKKAVFFGGVESSLRREIWPFLLHYYPYDSTFEQREQMRNEKYLQYQKIKRKRDKLSKDEAWKTKFWRSVQNIVEKDVIRTDRSHSYYKGEGNANVETLKEILLNYAVAHPHLGYTQGMSDLLSPILVELTNEADAYWCFVGLMQRTIFVSQPKDHDMDRQLLYLKELLRLMFPNFYDHLINIGVSLGLLFVHRWILLCFKREFSEQDALAIWETCWANVQTDYFHLFVALAIITSYSDDVLQQSLPADEMLLHFSNLSHHMNGKLIIIKARGLMHQFRLLERLPCTVQDLCSTCSVGMWDSGHVPAIECVGHGNIEGCPYLGVSSSKLPIADDILDLK